MCTLDGRLGIISCLGIFVNGNDTIVFRLVFVGAAGLSV